MGSDLFLKNVDEQVVDARKERAAINISTLNRMTLRNNTRKNATITALTIASALFLVLFGIHFRIQSLKAQYVTAFNWWYSSSGYLSTERTPFPDGMFPDVSVMSCAIDTNFPTIGKVKALTFEQTNVSSAGAQFLLDMVSAFHDRNLVGIHWNGSQEQLRYEDLTKFLPRNSASVQSDGNLNWQYIWESFNAVDDGRPVNPWAGTLWQNIDEFSFSPAVQEYYQDQSGKNAQLLTGLFRGGLVYLAVNTTASSTSQDMIYGLVGSKTSVSSGNCTSAQQTSAAIQEGSVGLGLGMAAAKFIGGPLAGVAGSLFVGSICGGLGAMHGVQSTKSCGQTSVENAT